MKQTIILTAIFLTMTSNLLGQNFGTVGTQWYYSEHAGGACPGNCEYLHLESVMDTVINGQATHKITQTHYRNTSDTVYYDPVYLYEQADTVFMWSFPKSRFLTLYIFNANVGDTLTLDAPDTLAWTDSTYRLVIDTIVNTVIDGVTLKKYRTIALDDYSFLNGGYFMDRIGGLDWFFSRSVTIPEAGGPIRCYSDAEIDTNFQSVDCDYVLYTSIENPTTADDIQVYPNPVTGRLVIKSEHPIEKVELFDLAGKRMATTSEWTVDVSDLPTGQYIVAIHLKTGQKVERKVVKSAP